MWNRFRHVFGPDNRINSWLDHPLQSFLLHGVLCMLLCGAPRRYDRLQSTTCISLKQELLSFSACHAQVLYVDLSMHFLVERSQKLIEASRQQAAAAAAAAGGTAAAAAAGVPGSTGGTPALPPATATPQGGGNNVIKIKVPTSMQQPTWDLVWMRDTQRPREHMHTDRTMHAYLYAWSIRHTCMCIHNHTCAYYLLLVLHLAFWVFHGTCNSPKKIVFFEPTSLNFRHCHDGMRRTCTSQVSWHVFPCEWLYELIVICTPCSNDQPRSLSLAPYKLKGNMWSCQDYHLWVVSKSLFAVYNVEQIYQ